MCSDFSTFSFVNFFYGISTKKKSFSSDLSSTRLHSVYRAIKQPSGKTKWKFTNNEATAQSSRWPVGFVVSATRYVLVSLCLCEPPATLGVSREWPQVMLSKALGLCVLVVQGLQMATWFLLAYEHGPWVSSTLARGSHSVSAQLPWGSARWETPRAMLLLCGCCWRLKSLTSVSQVCPGLT